MRVTILGASLNNCNLGVCALAMGIITCIVESFPDAEISILDYARSAEVFEVKAGNRRVSIPVLNLRMKLSPRNNVFVLTAVALLLRVTGSSRLKRWALSRYSILRRVHESEFTASIAGGDSFSDIYGLRRLIDVSLPQLLTVLLGNRLILFPQTIGPFKTRFGRAVARFLLTRSEVVYCRDEESHDVAKAIIGGDREGKTRVCYDVGFLLQPHAPAETKVAGISETTPPIIGVNPSGLLFMGGYKRDDAFKCRDRYVDSVYKTIDLFIRKNAYVLLIPHTLGTGSESDLDVCGRLYDELKHVYPGKIGFVQGPHSAGEMKHIIGQCEFFVGARMHACIAALSQSVPTVAVAYSRKYAGVMSTIGVERLVVDPREMSTEEILRIIENTYEQRDGIRRMLEWRIPDVKKRILRLASEVLPDLAVETCATR